MVIPLSGLSNCLFCNLSSTIFWYVQLRYDIPISQRTKLNWSCIILHNIAFIIKWITNDNDQNLDFGKYSDAFLVSLVDICGVCVFAYVSFLGILWCATYPCYSHNNIGLETGKWHCNAKTLYVSWVKLHCISMALHVWYVIY